MVQIGGVINTALTRLRNAGAVLVPFDSTAFDDLAVSAWPGATAETIVGLDAASNYESIEALGRCVLYPFLSHFILWRVSLLLWMLLEVTCIAFVLASQLLSNRIQAVTQPGLDWQANCCKSIFTLTDWQSHHHRSSCVTAMSGWHYNHSVEAVSLPCLAGSPTTVAYNKLHCWSAGPHGSITEQAQD